ncbi:COP9 signalosome complex subunit 2 isoform X1 [Iris pallida]|uniref:COP9 signalosome complex subunit 2 isoform X1 n=1 Tax=Iris pallida TaxID=29817 RepID=A0AAX6GG55_IRIPA|nr:COP9 signalosome complex subunit 2 isoform X1 [Iris pallida]
MGSDADTEDYGFEYSEEEPEEQDVDIENQYYNSKGDITYGRSRGAPRRCNRTYTFEEVRFTNRAVDDCSMQRFIENLSQLRPEMVQAVNNRDYASCFDLVRRILDDMERDIMHGPASHMPPVYFPSDYPTGNISQRHSRRSSYHAGEEAPYSPPEETFYQSADEATSGEGTSYHAGEGTSGHADESSSQHSLRDWFRNMEQYTQLLSTPSAPMPTQEIQRMMTPMPTQESDSPVSDPEPENDPAPSRRPGLRKILKKSYDRWVRKEK